MNLKRNATWLLPLLLILSGPLWWPAAGQLLKPRGGFDRPVPPATVKLKTFVMDQVVLTQNRGGRDELIIRAARVNSSVHDDLLELEGIEATLLGRDGRATVLTGGEAFYHNGQQVITVIDNVRLRTPDGQEIKTEALRYLARFQKVKTAEDVWFSDPGIQVSGGNLFYDLADGNFRVGGRVKVDFL